LRPVAPGGARVGAIVPHAPLLVPGIAGSVAEVALERIRVATRALADAVGPLTALVSPHAATSGVYIETRGDLSAFGVTRADARYQLHMDLAEALADRWGRPLIEEPLDHGIVVPLLLGFEETAVIPVGLAEDGASSEEEMALAEALRSFDVSVVASVNTGAGITGRAPLTEIEGSVALEHELRQAIARDAADLGATALRLEREGASCGGGPLRILSHLFAGRRFETLAHEWPVGVGYLVARTREVP
jgi:hypothetical protein